MFVQVDPYVGYTMLFCSQLGLNVTVLELEYKKLFFVIYIEAIIISCSSFINFIVVAVFINCSNSRQHML